MKRSLAVLATLALLSQGCSAETSDGIMGHPLTDRTGATATIGETFDGRWVLVNFWASFCKPCVREMPELQAMFEAGFDVVGVNAMDRKDLAGDLLQQTGVTYHILYDERGDLMAALGILALPATLIIDPQGNVVAMKSGEADRSQLEELARSAGWPATR